jgi:casein kinase 1
LNKYLSYVRNLGFEDTPDYDYLRDLFTQALKSTGEVEDGEYDWMKLNNGKGWEAVKSHNGNYLSAAPHVPPTTARAVGGGIDSPRGPTTPGVTAARLNAAQPPPPSPGKPVVGKTRERLGASGGAQQKRQSGVGGLGDVATPTASTQAQFQNSTANLPHRLSQVQGPGVSQNQNRPADEKPTAMQKFLKVMCCSR